MALALIAMGAAAAYLILSSRPPLQRPGDEALIARTRAAAPPDLRNETAIVMRLIDLTCVELRSRGDPSYMRCYDRRTGRFREEMLEIGF